MRSGLVLLIVLLLVPGCAERGGTDAPPTSADVAPLPTRTPAPVATTDAVDEATLLALVARLPSYQPEKVRVLLTGEHLRGTGYESPTTVTYDATTEELLVHFGAWPREGLVPRERITGFDYTATSFAHDAHVYYESPYGRVLAADHAPLRILAPGRGLTDAEGNGTLADLRRLVRPQHDAGSGAPSTLPQPYRATRVTHAGADAIRVDSEFSTRLGPGNATLILEVDPPRVRLLETHVPTLEVRTTVTRTVRQEFWYDDEVELEVPLALRRALTLEHTGGGYGNASPQTWTFHGGPVPVRLAEVEARLVENDERAPIDDVLNATVLWSMRLDALEGSHGNVSVRYRDLDGDGTVSAGDTLDLAGVEPGPGDPDLVLFDLVTGAAIVPFPGPAVAIALACAVALASRRRR